MKSDVLEDVPLAFCRIPVLAGMTERRYFQLLTRPSKMFFGSSTPLFHILRNHTPCNRAGSSITLQQKLNASRQDLQAAISKLVKKESGLQNSRFKQYGKGNGKSVCRIAPPFSASNRVLTGRKLQESMKGECACHHRMSWRGNRVRIS